MEGASGVCSEISKIDNELEQIELQIEVLLKIQEELNSRKEHLEMQLNENEVFLESKRKDWSLRNFEWSEQLEDLREKVFHIDEFRPLQIECMNVTMSGLDCILIMPTGGGKSLTFQLPALLSPGFTLVISPLVSLMEDQLMSLREYNIEASLLNASSSREHINYVHSNMIKKDSGLKILYVTPEKIAKSKRFMAKLEKSYTAGCLSRIVIDEVHCISQWGHDFRPDYKILGILKRQFPNCAILGLTATATSRVIEDVKNNLNLTSDCVILKASFNRPNLYYEVRMKPSSPVNILNEIASVIKAQFLGESGIVYCLSRKDSFDVALGLRKREVSAKCYHADLTPEARTKVHNSWTKGNLKVIVATTAFGMGINKANVRYVIHHTMSQSLENYYQESGRAGRDGKRAQCILYYNPTDSSRLSCMVFTEQTGLPNLYKMLSYSQDLQSCRRSLIGQHFGEEWKNEECKGMCDNCQRREKGEDNSIALRKDLTKEAQNVLKIVKRGLEIDERVTMNKLFQAWNGKGNKKLRLKDVSIPSLTAVDCLRFLIHLILECILREDFHFTPFSKIPHLVPGLRARELSAGNVSVSMLLSSQTSIQKLQKKASKKRDRAKSGKDDINCGTKIEAKKAKVEVDITDSDSLKPSSSQPNKKLNTHLPSSRSNNPVVINID
ncbi:ATP-dependent DNA helicase Q1-like [Dendronephthya gigantea]|uniref:ATP-dependent DNA helicase Q1-like n=1 Tax=Dendronephthya gigantea TaxID=151771 RepID=UPI00106BD158|nr:ATP-dependent DNA helicase Q1-like [Dendronephthya gigantea]